MWLSNRLRPKTIVTLDQEVTGVSSVVRKDTFLVDVSCLCILQPSRHSKMMFKANYLNPADPLCFYGEHNESMQYPWDAGPLSFLIQDKKLDAHANQWLSELRDACERS